jgi:quercetin dioxygenase-like cupin family protein
LPPPERKLSWTHLDQLDAIEMPDGFVWRPVRRHFDIRAFGVNAYTATGEGGQIVEEHSESALGHEEIYVVVRGGVTFTVGDEERDAPAGTFVHVLPELHRSATATADGTIVVVVGCTPGEPFVVHGWDEWAVAESLRRAGRTDEANAALQASIEAHPDAAGLVYNAACWAVADGDVDRAFDLLRRAMARDEGEVRRWAEHDTDLDPIRDDARFAELLG